MKDRSKPGTNEKGKNDTNTKANPARNETAKPGFLRV
jgi:hypothetical protein